MPPLRCLPVVLLITACAQDSDPSKTAGADSESSTTAPTDSGAPSEDTCVVDNTADMPSTATAYAALCAEHGLGVPPTIRCDDGERVPTLVDGEEVFESPLSCDSTSMLKTECTVGSKIQRFEGRDADGSALPDVTWVGFCRAAEATAASSVQLIGYHEGTGATCFFEANETRNSVLPERLGRDENNGLTGQMPAYNDPDFDRAFVPAPVQCVQCHQNNPFIRNPWLEGARLPEDPSEPVVPAYGAQSPYYVVGGADWDMRTIHIEGNACLSCHRIGMELDRIFAANGFDSNTYMPPSAPGSLEADYQALIDCWTAGPEATPGCDWVVPPAGDCEGGVVGEDYPYASNDFNRGGGTGGGEDSETCPDDFDPTEDCAPDGSKCQAGDGTWWVCESGAWVAY